MLHVFCENPTWNGTSLIKVPASRFVCCDSLIRKVKPYEINQVSPCNNKTLKYTPKQAAYQHNQDIMIEQNSSSQLYKGCATCQGNKNVLQVRERSRNFGKWSGIFAIWLLTGNFVITINFFLKMINLWFPCFLSPKIYLALLRLIGMLSYHSSSKCFITIVLVVSYVYYYQH